MARRIDTYLAGLIDEDKFAFYEAVRDFSDEQIAPHLLQWEREHQLVPDSCLQAMGEMGLFGLPIAEEYGGQGGDHLDLCLMGLALGYHSQAVAITPAAAAAPSSPPPAPGAAAAEEGGRNTAPVQSCWWARRSSESRG